MKVYNLSGTLVRMQVGISGDELFFHRENLQAGYYVFELEGLNLYRGKFIIR